MTVRLVTAAGLVVLVVASSACRLDAQTRAEGMFDRTLAVGGPVTLDIRTGSGRIEIHRGPAQSIHVIGRIRAGWSWDSTDVEERLHRIEAAPPIAQDGNAIRIGHVQDDRLFRNISISYDVTVPMDTQVQSHTGSGSQTITGVDGPVDASTGSGRLVLQDIRSDVRASTGSGAIEVQDGGGAFAGRTGSGGSGSIHIRFPADSAFDLNARTGSGAINTAHPITLVDAGWRKRLRGTVRGGGSRVDLSTASGSIRID